MRIIFRKGEREREKEGRRNGEKYIKEKQSCNDYGTRGSTKTGEAIIKPNKNRGEYERER